MVTPKFFSKSFRNTLTADSTVVNLKEKTEYFYEIAFILSSVLKEDHLDSIIPVVHRTFIERYRMIADQAEGKTVSYNANTVIRKLCNAELSLYKNSKARMDETVNFKQQHAISSSYGAEDTTFKRKSKRVRVN